MKYTLVIPEWNPPRLNQCRGRHWSVERKLKKEAVELLKFYAWQQEVPIAAGRRRVSLVVTLGKGQRRPDADAYDKLLLDSLKLAGLIVDDSARWLEGRLAVSFRHGPKPAAEITLEEVGGLSA